MAGRPCSVCTSPKRLDVEAALMAQNGSLRAIERQFGISRTSLENHKRAHMALLAAKAKEELAAVADAEAQEGAYTIVGHMKRLVDSLGSSLDQLGEWATDSDRKIALLARAEARQTVATMSKMLTTLGQASGEIPTGAAQMNVLVVKEGDRIRTEEWRYQDAMVTAAIDAMARRVPPDEVAVARREAEDAAWQARCRLGGGDVVDVDGEVVG